MWYIIIIIISAVAIVFGTYSCNLRNGKTSFSDKDISPDDTVKGVYKRNAIKEKLEALANSPAPTELKQGAMCYAAMLERDSAEYVCPKCGERTLYTENKGWFVRRDLNVCRTLADSVPAINLTLDESQYCKKCSPDIESPQLCITYQLADDANKTHICGITPYDLKIMKEFMQGKDKHITDNDGEVALKDFLPRLQELFGIKIESEKK
ncbi:MAG: hypothetical protein V1904_00640 [Bacteroidota bacterium]